MDSRKVKTIPPSRMPAPWHTVVAPARPPPAVRSKPSDAHNAITGVIVIAAGYFLWRACMPSEPTASEPTASDQGRELAWIEKGQESVREKLRDPESARFKDAFFHRGAAGAPMSCGWVNSKNGFGGYVGWMRYMSGGSSQLTFIESEMEDGFQETWAQFCGADTRR